MEGRDIGRAIQRFKDRVANSRLGLCLEGGPKGSSREVKFLSPTGDTVKPGSHLIPQGRR